MSVQIQGNQIKNSTIAAAKLDLTGTFDFSSGTLQAASPTNDSDVATRSYVLDLVNGLSYKDPVEVGTQSAPSATYNNSNGTLTADSNGAIQIDSISLSLNDRVLVKSFTSTAAVGNGIYEVTTVGDVSNPYVLTRSPDMDSAAQFPSAAVFVKQGSDADALFVCQSDSVTLGTTQITFAQASGAGSISAGSGLSKSGNTISVDKGAGLVFDGNSLKVGEGDGIQSDASSVTVKLDGSTLSKSASGLKVNSSGIDTLQLAANSVTNAKINSNVVGNGLTGGAGTALSVAAYNGIEVDINGVAVKLDGSTLTKSATGLKVSTNGISSNEIAAAAVTPTELSSGVAGDGITGGNGSALSVDLATAAGLEISSAKLQIKRQTNSALDLQATGLAVQLDGSTLQKGASGLSVNVIQTANIADAAVNESKIVSSSFGDGITGGSGTAISIDLKPSAPGLEFVSGQLALDVNTAKALTIDSSNGLEVKIENNLGLAFDGVSGGLKAVVDDATIQIDNANGQIKVKDSGIGTAKITDDSITLDKLKFRAEFEDFAGNGSATTFDLQYSVHSNWFKKVVVYRNGLRLKFVASNPANVDEYSVANNGTGSVCRVTFGSAPGSSDSIFVDYMYNPS